MEQTQTLTTKKAAPHEDDYTARLMGGNLEAVLMALGLAAIEQALETKRSN